MNSEIKNIGKYKISGEIGMGAMGIVYKGEDPLIGRTVAIKTIRFDPIKQKSEQDQDRKRFIREAHSAGNLSHPNIVTIYEVGEDDGLIYIVMEYVAGQSLDVFLESNKDLPLPEIIRLISRIGKALDYAHKRGVVHRDVKPANILVDEEGNPHLVDFGIARVSTSTMTQTRMVMGTPYYMSPEQISGKSVDNRADVFSLGVVLYEMLTRRKPFPGDNITTVIYKIINEEPLPVRDFRDSLPPDLEQVLQKALAKRPEIRYQSCGEFIAALTTLSLSKSRPEKSRIVARDKPLAAAATANRKPLLLVLASMMAVTLVVIISVVVYSSRQKETGSSGGGEAAVSAVITPLSEYWNTGQQLLQDGRLQEALAAFQQVLLQDKDHFEAQFNLAQIYHELSQDNEALNAFEKARDINPQDPRPYLSLGEIYTERDQPDLALENFMLYTQVLPEKKVPEKIVARIAELSRRSEPDVNITEDTNLAVELTTPAKTTTKTDPLPEERLIDKKSKEPEFVIEESKDTPDLDPLIEAGVAAFNKGDYADCLKKMEDVLQIDPDNNYAGYYLSLARRRLSQETKDPEPVPIKKKTVEKRIPDRSQILFDSGMNAYNRADYAKSIQIFKQVLDLDSNHSSAREYLNSAVIKQAPRDFESLVQQYIRSLRSRTLVEFYRSVCLPALFNKIKPDAELIFKLYEKVDATAANINSQASIAGENIYQADVSFEHIMTGSDSSGANKIIFEGVFVWRLENKTGNWQITEIDYRN